MVTEEVIIPLKYVPVRSTQGQNFYMRNYPIGNDQRYLSVEGNNLQMTNAATETKCKFLVKTYPHFPQIAVSFQHVTSSKFISATTTQNVTLIDSTPPLIFQSSDSKLFFRNWDSGLDHYYFESVTNPGHYLAYNRVNDDVKLLQLSASSLQNKTGNALDAFFRHVPLN
ncbi:uncharacterized protein LOC117117896 [Anneissia japonica]|uniref:uncharacterized protein LOC117117896 n=1 Tax=Anneissia japonica TaxID=1529436 RepID=UPI001425ACEC|nr:uncharacterized protein LOC117117896 [Anneissia japonica]